MREALGNNPFAPGVGGDMLAPIGMPELAPQMNHPRREAELLREEAEGAFEAGDYRLTRQLDERVVRTAPNSDVGRAAQVELNRLRVDPAAIISGAVAVLLYVVTWVFSLL